MLADTSFIIDVMRGEENAVRKVDELEKDDKPLNITSISLFELYSGIGQVEKTEKEKEKIQEVLRSRAVYEFDRIAGEIAGRIDGMLCNEGKMVEPQDSMISGIAIRENEKILTRNLDHFRRISDISTLNVEKIEAEE
ncbi:MAG: PIN domain-containing protein [Candidatus Thermoplasmatota archaeon]|nr:PIN domain-containing protein [Candidatus Thermoplasmatota archaeon]MBS3789647.1 PIN domain-containing protein [Candidatus Thermoplasmatota archaeon]